MSERDESEYLWDRSAPIDAELEQLERLLGRWRHAGGSAPRSRPRRRLPALALTAAAAAAVAAVLWWWRPTPEPVLLVRASGGAPLASDSRFVAAAQEQLRLGEYGELTLEAGSELEIERLDHDQTRLFLHRGELNALVYANARPGFFEVGTPSARCIDLGCRYQLTVDEHGDAEVVVSLGQVAFESDGREVFVPHGATCRANPRRGAGTPRFLVDQGSAFAAALDRFDAAPAAERRAAAGEVLAAVTEPHQSLSVWHLLQDRDREVVTEAERALEQRFGALARDRAAWKQALMQYW